MTALERFQRTASGPGLDALHRPADGQWRADDADLICGVAACAAPPGLRRSSSQLPTGRHSQRPVTGITLTVDDVTRQATMHK